MGIMYTILVTLFFSFFNWEGAVIHPQIRLMKIPDPYSTLLISWYHAVLCKINGYLAFNWTICVTTKDVNHMNDLHRRIILVSLTICLLWLQSEQLFPSQGSISRVSRIIWFLNLSSNDIPLIWGANGYVTVWFLSELPHDNLICMIVLAITCHFIFMKPKN